MTPPSPTSADPRPGPAVPHDLICLSHLRWDFVFQRPQHLMTGCARDRRVFFFEEPLHEDPSPSLRLKRLGNLTIATPLLPHDVDPAIATAMQRVLLDELIAEHGIGRFTLWYYTPMALSFSRHLHPAAIVYDCMDELSAFAQAPAGLRELEAELLERADLVFTGGQSLYEAKRDRHPAVHAFPSSVDVRHFARARVAQQDPPDQAGIGWPRLGFFGVIDERMDLALIEAVAAARPDWQLVLIGPTAKIEESALPRRANIHYLGRKSYEELPSYLAGWDVALMPFAHNESTRFISPTKTPEYLAAGRPVVSTSIRDVVRPYGHQGLVRIADGVEAFVAAIDAALAEPPAPRIAAADAFLARMSWEATWLEMRRLMDAAAMEGRHSRAPSRRIASPLAEASRPSL